MKRIYTLIIVILVSMDCWGLLSCEARQVAGFGITNPASEPHQVELVQSATAEAQFWNQLETQTLLYPPTSFQLLLSWFVLVGCYGVQYTGVVCLLYVVS